MIGSHLADAFQVAINSLVTDVRDDNVDNNCCNSVMNVCSVKSECVFCK